VALRERSGSKEMINAEDWQFKFLLREIKKSSKIDVEMYKENFLRRRIGIKMRDSGIESYYEYAKLIRDDEAELNSLLNTLTINVTEFMRDKTPFECFKDLLLPRIIEKKEKSGSKLIRIWSAGCAYGEEPYSIAICALEFLRDRDEKYTFSIYGTDIDKNCLKNAEIGIYPKKALKNLSKWQIINYFNEIDGSYRIKDEVKRVVKFRYHDLTNEETFSKFFDVIFCRNVVIYFSEEQKRRALRNFYDSLLNGGFLITGRSESMLPSFLGKFKAINTTEKVYQKME